MVRGQAIRQLREERGYSLHELAKRAGLSISYLSEIERGAKTPSLKTVEKIAAALNISKAQLIQDEKDERITLGQKVRVLRQEKGLSLAELAGRVGISTSYLSEIERDGVYPAVHTLKRLAEELGVAISSLVGTGTSMGQKLRQVREQQGMSQAALARAAGISPGMVGQIEHGRVQPSLQTIERLAAVVGVSPCYFITDGNQPEDILRALGPETISLLYDPNVQSVLRLICACTTEEICFILNFIRLYKKSCSGEIGLAGDIQQPGLKEIQQ